MIPKRRIMPIFIPHAGCEHDCVFCDQRRISGTVESISIIESAKKQIVNFNVGSDPAEIAFYGGSFTAIPVKQQCELLEAAQPFLRQNQLNSIRISTRPDCLDACIIRRLQSYGVTTVELGAQSMCDDVLYASQRGHLAYDIERAAELVRDSGLALILQMMTGLPEDTREKSLYTANRFIELRPDGVRIYPTVVVRGTKLHELWKRGDYQEHEIGYAVELCAELYLLFREAGIPVIRLGLNPSRTLSSGDAVAGAYHPAFGELVYSRVYYNAAVTLLQGVAEGSDITLAVAAGRVSMMTGQRRCNINMLKQKFSLRSIRIIQTELQPEELVAVFREKD